MGLYKFEWKKIPDCNYEVSNYGIVRHIYKHTILKPKIDKDGYYRYWLYRIGNNGGHFWKYCHRLVAQAFIPNPNNYCCVNHRDENKQNNCVDNLEWCDNIYNLKYGTGQIRSAISRSKNILVKEINKKFLNARECAKYLNCSRKNVDICVRKNFKCRGYTLCYIK